MKFILGANYWGRDWGTEMWLHYDGKKIREEMKLLAEYGVKNLRMFPNWRDFQPVERACEWCGQHGEYINARTGEPIYDDGVDMEMIEHFRDFCHAAEENGIEIVAAIVTGWMSGKLYCPPVLNGKNLITDPEALMWMRRFIKRFVHELKDEKAIVMWGLGNECNCLSPAKTPYESYNWTAAVVDAIRSEDTTRPICSDMHSLESGVFGPTLHNNPWLLEHQGELNDMVCTHPYPSPTVNGDVEPYNRMRTTCLPTAQTIYYAGVSGKPAYIQESGTFSQTIGNVDMSGDFMRIQILSALANNLKGYQWWCAWEQKHLDFPPYSWSMIERELGLFYQDNSPKPVAYTMQEMSKLVDKLPEGLPQREVNAVCVLSIEQKREHTAISTILLGKQAGIDMDVVYTQNGDIPERDIYFVPCISGWKNFYKKTWMTLLDRVQKGATMYLSFNGGQITDFPEIVGAKSGGFLNNVSRKVDIDGETVPYTCKEIVLEPTTAEVLLTNDNGNPVFLKNKYGKGTVYFLNMPVERITFEGTDLYNTTPCYKIYKEVGKEVLKNKIVTADDRNIGITIHPVSDNECYVTALNYSDKDIVPDIQIKDGWEISETVYGNLEMLKKCDGAFLKLRKI